MAALPVLTPPSRLDTLLASSLAAASERRLPLVIHAGHYALFNGQDGSISDLLDGAETEDDVLGFRGFCKSTWESVCRSVANTLPGNGVQMIVLVNDWQYLTANESGRRRNERSINRMRSEYYRRTSTLPTYHLERLKHYGLAEHSVLRYKSDLWLFSESSLRNELHPIIKEVLADGSRSQETGVRRHFNERGEPIIHVCDDETGEFPLVYCGNTNCAGEVVSLLGNLYRRGVRQFLNIYPSQCREPVSAGTRLAYKIFNCNDMLVTNAAVSTSMIVSGDDPYIATEHFGDIVC